MSYAIRRARSVDTLEQHDCPLDALAAMRMLAQDEPRTRFQLVRLVDGVLLGERAPEGTRASWQRPRGAA